MGIGTDLRNFWNAKNEWHEQMWEGIEDDPWRLLTGFDPASTEISNFLLNRDDDPLGDWFGGPTSEQMRTGRYRPEEKSAANKGKVIIPAVVGTILTAGALGGAGGAAGGAGGSGGAAAGGAGGAGGAAGLGAQLGNTAGVLQGSSAAGTLPGTIAIPGMNTVRLGNTGGVLMGTGGAPAGSMAAAGPGATAGGAGGSFWKDFGQNLLQNPPQFQQPQQAQDSPQHQFTQQLLAPLMAPQNEQEAQARNNAMSLLLQQHRG